MLEARQEHTVEQAVLAALLQEQGCRQGTGVVAACTVAGLVRQTGWWSCMHGRRVWKGGHVRELAELHARWQALAWQPQGLAELHARSTPRRQPHWLVELRAQLQALVWQKGWRSCMRGRGLWQGGHMNWRSCMHGCRLWFGSYTG